MAVRGLDRHLRRLRALRGPELIRAAGAAVFEAADDIKAEAQVSISRGSVSGAGHLPSRPGEPPNFDTGFLAGAIIAEQTGPLTAEIGALAPYSAALEFGTSKVAARPFLRPARDKNLDKAQRRLAQQIERLISRSG